MKFILGKKIGMTQVFRNDGTVVPVTRVHAGPCVITQVKDRGNKGSAVQIGFGTQKTFRLSNAERGHLKGIAVAGNAGLTVRHLRTLPLESGQNLARGNVMTVRMFETGEKVHVTGRSKGRGFQGVVKRHGFHGSPASHGHKDQLRMPGSIGATGPQRVFKGTRMGGHMGDDQVTVKNLEIVEIKQEENELWIKGAIPGARNGLLVIVTSEGKIQIEVEKIAEKIEENNGEVQNFVVDAQNLSSDAAFPVVSDIVQEATNENIIPNS